MHSVLSGTTLRTPRFGSAANRQFQTANRETGQAKYADQSMPAGGFRLLPFACLM
jgi:hypothetical protein